MEGKQIRSGARLLDDWLGTYVAYTDNTEPPLSYRTWCGIHAISSALERRVYIARQDQNIYPNQYIVLVGASGRTRKGTAMDSIRWFINKVNLNVAGGDSITKEQLVIDLMNARADYTMPEGNSNKYTYQCALTHQIPELSTFLKQKDSGALSWLTAWYDSPNIWTHATKTQGTAAVEFMCYNMLGATAPDWLPGMFTAEAVGGGFTSRVIFVYEERKAKVIPELEFTDEMAQTRRMLLNDLLEIKKMRGQMQLSPTAKKLYADWYKTQERLLEEGRPPIADPRFDGYIARRQIHALKLAMALSASNSPSLVITEGNIERAISLLEVTEVNMANTFLGLGDAPYVRVQQKVVEYLRMYGQATYATLLRQFKSDIDDRNLQNILEGLRKMGHVEMHQEAPKPKQARKPAVYKYVA